LKGALHEKYREKKISGAKAQRRKALPRFQGFSLRLFVQSELKENSFFFASTCSRHNRETFSIAST